MDAPADHSHGDLPSNDLPPESPLPLPEPGFGWLKEAGNVAAEPPPVSTGFATHQPRAEEQSRTASANKRIGLLSRRSSIKAITAFGAVGIAVLIYAEFSSDKSAVADMLGTELIKLVPESVPVPRTDLGMVDPRLADPVALDMLKLENEPLASDTTEPAHTEGFMAPMVPSEESPEVGLPQAGPSADSMAPHQVPAAEPTGAPGTAPSTSTAPTAPVAPPAPGVSNEELMLRLQRVELLLAQLQLQAKTAAATPTTTPANSSAAVAPTPATAQRRVEPAARPAPARTVKATPPKPVKQAKAAAAAPAAAPAPVLGGQLVSVDMWNGEASVVIASGLPGDRRVRVLRPGDVVNGMALRSADPVTRSATFVAPGSQGLTLYVSQGG